MISENKLTAYNEATEQIVDLLDYVKFNKDSGVDKSMIEMRIRAMRESFKYKLTHFKVFSIKEMPKICSTGFCGVSSYDIYRMTGEEKNWKFMTMGVHWWILNIHTGINLDITFDQMEGRKPPYHLGREDIRVLDKNNSFTKDLVEKANILARCAGLDL